MWPTTVVEDLDVLKDGGAKLVPRPRAASGGDVARVASSAQPTTAREQVEDDGEVREPSSVHTDALCVREVVASAA